MLVYQVPIPEPLRFLEPRETETRKMHALEEYGLMHVKLYEDIARHGHIATTYAYPVKVEGRYVMDPSPTPKFDNPKMHMSRGAAAVRRRPREAHLRRAALHRSGEPRLRGPPVRDPALRRALRALRRRAASISTRSILDDQGGHMFVCSDTDHCEDRRDARPSRQARRPCRWRRRNDAECQLPNPAPGHRPLASSTAAAWAAPTCRFELWPGEVLAVVGESGSGKTTLLNCLSTRLRAELRPRRVPHARRQVWRNLYELSEAERRFLMRTDWGFVHQNPADGLRMTVSAGANVGERLMAVGDRHYGSIRSTAIDWLGRVEIAEDRIDDQPRAFSGGMRQRLQIARNLVTHPRLVFMDEPTGGLDVSVQARLLDLLRGLVSDLGLVGHHRHPRPRRGAAAVAPDDGDEGRPRHRAGPHRPGARRSARALHPASRFLDPAGVTMTALFSTVRDVAKSFTMHLRDGIVLPVVDGVGFRGHAGECVVLGGPSGAGKSILLKMVYGNYGVDAGSIALLPSRRAGRPRARPARAPCSTSAATPSAMSASSSAPCRASPTLDVVAEPLVSRGTSRDEAHGEGPRTARPAQPAGAAVVAAARDLLGRRAAARQHRPRLHHRRIRCCCSTSRQPRSMPPTAPWWSR